MKACRPEAGISSMPGGQSFYLRCLQWHTSMTLSPQQVHDIGLEEVNRIRGEMQKVSQSWVWVYSCIYPWVYSCVYPWIYTFYITVYLL